MAARVSIKLHREKSVSRLLFYKNIADDKNDADKILLLIDCIYLFTDLIIYVNYIYTYIYIVFI